MKKTSVCAMPTFLFPFYKLHRNSTLTHVTPGTLYCIARIVALDLLRITNSKTNHMNFEQPQNNIIQSFILLSLQRWGILKSPNAWICFHVDLVKVTNFLDEFFVIVYFSPLRSKQSMYTPLKCALANKHRCEIKGAPERQKLDVSLVEHPALQLS